MFERFTDDARPVVVLAQEHARRLGHRFIGCEHLLLAVVSTDQQAAAVLRERGVTPERVEEEIVRRVGLGAGPQPVADLDRDALASIGIDLDAVRARIEASFGPAACPGGPGRPPAAPPAAQCPGLAPRAARAQRAVPAPPVPASTGSAGGGRCATRPYPVHPAPRRAWSASLREAQAAHDNHIGVEHVALGLIGMNSGMVPPVLSALGVSAAPLRAAILDRYRKAS